MYLQDFSYFLKIVETGNISRAAEHLYVTQPALTRYLKRLEEELGAELFDRTEAPLTLTPAGECFLDYVKKNAKLQEALRGKLEDYKNSGASVIRIGMGLWRANTLLPTFLSEFSRKHPEINVKLTEGIAAEIESALVSGDLDMGIMDLPLHSAHLSYYPLKEERILLAGNKENSFIRGFGALEATDQYPVIDIRAFSGHPFIITQPAQHFTVLLESLFALNDTEINCIFRTVNISTALNMVMMDMGFTFLPEMSVKSLNFPEDKLALFEVGPQTITSTLALAFRRKRYITNAMNTFHEELRAYCQSI